jgi:eukaryotic-like serine/threonine-protein kinase
MLFTLGGKDEIMRVPLPPLANTKHDFPVGIGDVVSGKYEVDAIVGEGGMGFVLRAVHTELRDFVALKFLRPEAVARPDIKARFRDEARAAVRLRSEHVAQVRDVGEHNGLPYIVMEYLNGRDLRDILMQEALLPIETIAEYIIQACAGLAEAHALGIVHRDVKPENLFVSERSTGGAIVKILDFGISKVALVDNTSEMALHGGTREMIGSPLYMSPEQIRTPHEIDRRVDIWSLGVVLYELLTGVHPFGDAGEFPLLVANILEQPNPTPSARRRGVSPELDEIVSRALAKNPADRYLSAGDLAMALAPFARTGARQLAAETVRSMIARGWSEISLSALNSDYPAPPSAHNEIGAESVAPRGVAGSDSTPPGVTHADDISMNNSGLHGRVPTSSVVRRLRTNSLVEPEPATWPTKAIVGGIAAMAIAIFVAAMWWHKRSDDLDVRFRAPATADFSAPLSAGARAPNDTSPLSAPRAGGSADTAVVSETSKLDAASTPLRPGPSTVNTAAVNTAPRFSPEAPRPAGTPSKSAHPDLDIRPER